MSTANLLVLPPDNQQQQLIMFGFEEAMAHRTLLGGMSPLDRFSVLPYLLDPINLNDAMWLMNQQQASNDFGSVYGTVPGSINQIDTDFENPAQRKWFTFVNHLEMYDAMLQLPPELLAAW